MSNVLDFFDISWKGHGGVPGLTEDAVRDLVKGLEVVVEDDNFAGFVMSSGGTRVKFNFDPNGNFDGVTARIGSKNVQVIPGVSSNYVGLFWGSPNSQNPGEGWEVLSELTVKYLNQPEADEGSWELFFARRVPVINA